MKTKNILTALIFVLVSMLIYCFHLKSSLFYHPDFARDMHEILRISQGKIVWLGPKLTFGGLYLGPYYFYLYVPAYIFSHGSIISVHFFNALLFACAIGYFFYKVVEQKKYFEGVFFPLILLFLPMFVTGARNPSNAYSFVPLFLFFLTYLYFAKSLKTVSLAVLGFLYGVIINFHFINVVFFPAVFAYLWWKVKDKKQLIFFLAGIAVSFLPLIIFEIKHHFIMFKNTFIEKSYVKWLTNTNIPNGLAGKKNVLANIWFLSENMKGYLLINPLFIYFLLGVFFYFKKPEVKTKIIYFGSLVTLVLTALILRFQFIPHYLFGLSFFLFFNALILFLSLKIDVFKKILISLFLIYELITFWKTPYVPSWRTPERFEKAVNYVIKNHLVSKTNFNIIQITKQNLLATLGFEYRYFFRKNGYQPDSEFLYNQSRELVIFSEIPYQDISQFNSWEAEQFGKKYFKKAKSYKLPEVTIFILQKSGE
jgi:hypothetical protein